MTKDEIMALHDKASESRHRNGAPEYNVTSAATRRELSEAIDSLLAAPQEPYKRDWIEDFPHENGQYQNVCYSCSKMFFGHKRRVYCRGCVSEPATKEGKGDYIGNGMFSNETERDAAKGWAEWCRVRGNTMLADFLDKAASTP